MRDLVTKTTLKNERTVFGSQFEGEVVTMGRMRLAVTPVTVRKQRDKCSGLALFLLLIQPRTQPTG